MILSSWLTDSQNAHGGLLGHIHPAVHRGRIGACLGKDAHEEAPQLWCVCHFPQPLQEVHTFPDSGQQVCCLEAAGESQQAIAGHICPSERAGKW